MCVCVSHHRLKMISIPTTELECSMNATLYLKRLNTINKYIVLRAKPSHMISSIYAHINELSVANRAYICSEHYFLESTHCNACSAIFDRRSLNKSFRRYSFDDFNASVNVEIHQISLIFAKVLRISNFRYAHTFAINVKFCNHSYRPFLPNQQAQEDRMWQLRTIRSH